MGYPVVSGVVQQWRRAAPYMAWLGSLLPGSVRQRALPGLLLEPGERIEAWLPAIIGVDHAPLMSAASGTRSRDGESTVVYEGRPLQLTRQRMTGAIAVTTRRLVVRGGIEYLAVEWGRGCRPAVQGRLVQLYRGGAPQSDVLRLQGEATEIERFKRILSKYVARWGPATTPNPG